MKYIISRTSISQETQPCEEAFMYLHTQWHTRTCNEKEFNERFSEREGLWRSKGKNHGITNEGYITRQEPDEKLWTIEIKNLKELHKLSEKYGELVVNFKEYSSKSPRIEIYDDYRE